MTDRFAGCVVTFDREMRQDDAEALLSAIRMLKGVAHVEPGRADFSAERSAVSRERMRILDALRDVLWPKDDK